MSLYLSIDLGTTGCRSILFDGELRQLAFSYEEYGLITPSEKYTEQNAELWWELTLSTAKDAIRKADVDPRSIKSISVSSQGITVVPVDRFIKPLRNAISWLDVRCEEETAQLKRELGSDNVFLLTGKRISAGYTLPKLMWMQKHEPQIYASAWKFLMPMDFLIARFTGNCITDHSMASGTLMYDIKNQRWSREILDRYGIEEERLPTLAYGGESAGLVLPEVAKELGLSPDCTVAVGAQDQKCAAFGVGLCEGVMSISLGTAAAVTKLWREAKTEINTGVGWCGYVERDRFVTEGVISTAGTCLRWVRDLYFKGEKYNVIDSEAAQVLDRGSSLLFYPYLNGTSAPSYYPDATGCFYGASLATERGDFALAVMEGIAFQIRILLEAMEAYGNIHTLVIFGGGANSALWCQIIADATGMKITVPKTTEAASAGAARLAAMAIGQNLPPLENGYTYIPSARAEDYDRKYQTYRAVEKRLWKQEALL